MGVGAKRSRGCSGVEDLSAAVDDEDVSGGDRVERRAEFEDENRAVVVLRIKDNVLRKLPN